MKLHNIIVAKEEPIADFWHKRLGYMIERGMKTPIEKKLLHGIKGRQFKFREHYIMGT